MRPVFFAFGARVDLRETGGSKVAIVSTQYQTVVGLEIHAQLMTRTKLFCSCSTEFGNSPNSNVCPVCLGLPGSLPVLNRRAVQMAVRAGLALGCDIQASSIFARKNYFYPDLPKGYQISQYEEPIATDGHLEIEADGVRRDVGIIRVHMEEDAGKNIHGVGGDSLVDLNRTCVPLIEIVSAPDMRSSGEAAAYMRALRDILVFIGVNDGNLQEGSFRCDANVSIRPVGSETLGTRCELKNLNSFRFVQRAIDSEVARQIAIIDAGGTITQETRAFDPDTGLTRTLRSKEEAHDYRYFPEPDLPPILVGPELVEAERQAVGELPDAVRTRWVEQLEMSVQTAATLSQHPEYVKFFEKARAKFDGAVKLANWIQTEVLRSARIHGLKAQFTVSPDQVAELLNMVEAGEINGKIAKQVFAIMEGTSRSAAEIVKELGIEPLADASAIEAICQKVLDSHPGQVSAARAGKKGIVGFFVGKIMKETNGGADPRVVSQTLERLIGSGG